MVMLNRHKVFLQRHGGRVVRLNGKLINAVAHFIIAPNNRSSVIRIPEVLSNQAAAATRAELRSPDPQCNPYLAFAALLKAGLTGIKNKYKLPKPVEENLYNLSLDQLKAKGIASLPASLAEALQAFSSSDVAKELAGNRFHETFATLKATELEEFNTEVTDWEIRKYL